MKVYYHKILPGLFIALIGVCCAISSYAQRQPVITATPLVGDSVKAGKVMIAADTLHFDTSLHVIDSTRSLDNIICLSINEFTNKVFPDSFHVTVRLQSDYITATGSMGTKLDTLQIFYSKNYPYNSKAIKFYKNYYSLSVEVLDVTITGAADSLVRRLLTLENMIVIDRFFNTNCTAISSISSDSSHVRTDGELSVSWPGISFIPAYDLEWTYIDSSALADGNYNTSGTLDPDLIFKNNATRVTVTGNSYLIPALYDGHGTLFFRVRTTQNTPEGEVVAGQWSTVSGSGGLGSYEFAGHQRALNWQATTTFAEEGKRKSVVQYYDGSLKARQTVTKDNTTGKTVVAETLYDKQGRPVIQVLPAPTISSLIAYTPLFNVRGINTAEYDKSVYDTLVADNEYCCVAADSMSSTSGAANYYSPLNPLVAKTTPDVQHQFVPNAFGYPFTETRYTRDNTGRIDRQGGVGPMFRVDSAHATKYFYGTPEQKDLDALFGTEVGDFAHYEKNMVRDANGQYSVSYVDMHGRTVATALAGNAPTSLQRLTSYDSLEQTDQLLTPSNNIIQDNAIRSSKSILVPVKGDYTFNYSLSPESLSLDDCKSTTVCYDCLYDLTITINDNCNNEQFSGHPKIITLKNFSLFKTDSTTHNLDTTCTAANVIDTSFTVTLEEGSYDITKTLSVSMPAMQYYRDSIYIPHNTCKSYLDLVLEQLDSIRSRIDCTPDSAVTNVEQAWREQMMADLTPESGQYAQLHPLVAFKSIFDIVGTSIYKYQTLSGYLDEDGNPDFVYRYDDTHPDGVPVAPQNLTPQEFVDNFKVSWAETLLPLHPEYRLLLEYEKLKSAYNWESDFFNTQTYAAAVAKGYLNPAGSASAPASNFSVSGKLDSLFIALGVSDPSIVTSAKADINDKLLHFVQKEGVTPAAYYNLWAIVTSAVQCNSSDAGCINRWGQNGTVFNPDSICTADLDIAWQMFRAEYLNIREDWIDNYTRTKSVVHATDIRAPYVPVFPDRSIITYPSINTSEPVSEQYGGYHGNSDDPGIASNNLDAFLMANCTAYARTWWQNLAPCHYTAADSIAILLRLITVAYEGADASHPFGSSTVKPSSTNTDRSFEDVISSYNHDHYPSMDPLACNAYLIPNPKPYDLPGIIVNMPIIQAPDSCTCSRINTLYTQFIADSALYHHFSSFMQLVHGTRISDGALDTLRNLCSVTSDCKYLAQPIIVPPALQCNAGNACADCAMVRSLYDSFTVKFDVTPTFDDNDTTQHKINYLFQNYMNAHLGFGKVYTEYLDFMQTCDETDSLPCGDTTHWTVYNPGNNLTINADMYANSSNNIAPPSHFFHDGLFDAPTLAQAPQYILVNKRDSVSALKFNTMMQWRVKPSNASAMINPFVSQRPVTFYMGGIWHRDPADTSWWIGETYLTGNHHDGEFIKGMGISSNDSGLVADWVKIINVNTGNTLYMDGFSLNSGKCGPFLCGQQAADSTIIMNFDPCADTTLLAQQGAQFLFDIYREKLKGQFEKAYTNKCLSAGHLESFTVQHPLTEYHYTLYYYDQAGNLIKTVPPEGVLVIRRDSWMDSVKTAREANTTLKPAHRMVTTYRYNSLNQVVSQQSPDGGVSHFWYDRLGRVVVSQNAKQAEGDNYSYTLYDQFGRITELGQKNHTTQMTADIARSQSNLNAWLSYTYTVDGNAVIGEQVTQMLYDIKDPATSSLNNAGYIVDGNFQKYYTLRNRVSYKRYYDLLKWNGSYKLITDYNSSKTFSYDIHGNVDTLLQHYKTGLISDHGNNQFKLIAYKYDLLNNKVNEVHYQPGMPDETDWRYEYDARNRLSDVYYADRSQVLNIPGLEEHDVKYTYYRHEPLARIELGQQKVQGIDFAYSLHSWLKGVNSDTLIDGDGMLGSVVAKDAVRFSLNYFNGDYFAIGNAITTSVFRGHSAFLPDGEYRPLYNANISSMVVGIPKLGETRLYNYGYDQLNRIVSMDAYTGYNTSSHLWGPSTLDSHNGEYKERISYDANGNILTYHRNGSQDQVDMDQLKYEYNKDGDGYITNNRLRHVKDSVSDGNYAEDIDGQEDDNYEYDAIGNLIKDSNEGVSNIEWNVFGKIITITKINGSEIKYMYDVDGNKIMKTENGSSIIYVRDAGGNVISIYQASPCISCAGGPGIGKLKQTEIFEYGLNRIGSQKVDRDMDVQRDDNNYVSTRGTKFFEIGNHLNNILVVISDKKHGHISSGGVVDYYLPDIIEANDYYPFGLQMPGRKFTTTSNYRFGFNGKERDNSLNDNSNYDYGFRIYNPSLGRFLSVDPLAKEYPWYSPYQFAGNKPIIAIDLDGNEEKITVTGSIEKNKPATQTTSSITEKDKTALLAVVINKIYDNLELLEVKNPHEPSVDPEWGPDGLSAETTKGVIKQTISQFIIQVGSSSSTSYTFRINPSLPSDIYSETYDFNYDILGDKDQAEKIKSSVLKATTIISYAETANDFTQVLPEPAEKVLGKVAKGSEVLAAAIEGDDLELTKIVAKLGMEFGLEKLAERVPSLASVAEFLGSKTLGMTISMTFSNSGPPERNYKELEKKWINELRNKVIAAMIVLFETNNKPKVIPAMPLNSAEIKVDNTMVIKPQHLIFP